MKSYKWLMENIPYPGHNSFLEGREQVEDESHAGRPSTSKIDDNVERVRYYGPQGLRPKYPLRRHDTSWQIL
jgi:hypothetical protein